MELQLEKLISEFVYFIIFILPDDTLTFDRGLHFCWEKNKKMWHALNLLVLLLHV